MNLLIQEEQFVRQSLVISKITSQKMLIKDHNKINDKGGLPTRLLILSNKLYSCLIQDWLSIDEENAIQGKGKLLTRHHFPGILPEVIT